MPVTGTAGEALGDAPVAAPAAGVPGGPSTTGATGVVVGTVVGCVLGGGWMLVEVEAGIEVEVELVGCVLVVVEVGGGTCCPVERTPVARSRSKRSEPYVMAMVEAPSGTWLYGLSMRWSRCSATSLSSTVSGPVHENDIAPSVGDR